MMLVGILGLQGAFVDHIPHLLRCGVSYRILRSKDGLEAIDRLIIPGGESTVMTRFLKEYGMVEPIKRRVSSGMPVWGICAGAILLCRRVDGLPGLFGFLPASATRNAYGRQLQSAQVKTEVPLFGIKDYPAVFIRAPRILEIDEKVKVHARRGEDPVFLKHKRIIATTFHPELIRDSSLFHRYFLSI